MKRRAEREVANTTPTTTAGASAKAPYNIDA